MTDNEILEQLQKNNPFVDAASPEPFENNNPDLLQLSRDASEYIEQLTLYKRRQPFVPLAGVVLGEAGSGKTHMLMRILRRLRSNGRPTVFVSVRTFLSPEIVTQHLLNEIVISLKRQHSKGRTQFDMILSEFWDAYQERRREDGFNNLNRIEDAVKYIARDIPGLEKVFLKCLAISLSPKDFSTRLDVLEWLREGLDEEDSLKLGLPFRDLSSMSDSKRENEARRVLIALGLILAYAKVPMIVCFDQLDSMKDRELILAWGNIIALLMNELSGILPLCFLRSDMWNLFRDVLDSAVIQRLQNNTMILKNCLPNQSKQLIFERIKANPELKDNADVFFQYLIKKMGDTLSTEHSPRDVIELANRAITSNVIAAGDDIDGKVKNDIEDIDSQIKKIYENEYEKIQNAPAAWPPNSEQLKLALEVWLNSHEGFEFQTGNVRNIKLTGKYKNKNLAFVVCTSKIHFVATAGLKQGTDFINQNKQNFCFYVSEKKLMKPGYKQARAALAEFEKSGGRAIMLDDKSRVQWYALTALINRIDNGDVNLYLSSGQKTASREDIKNFVRTINLLDFPFEKTRKKMNSPVLSQEINNASLCNILAELVKLSPMSMLALNKAVNLLSQREIIITADELLSFVENEEIFKAYKTENKEPIISFSKRR